MLARLDTKQQALIMDHAVPMPVVIQTRTYDADFYAAVGFQELSQRWAGRVERVNLLRGQKEEGID